MSEAATGQAIVKEHGLAISPRTANLIESLEAKPGAVVKPMSPSRSSTPNVLMYKVFGKVFAIMSIRGTEGVILKCDPQQIALLKEQYAGVGHRSHLDRRHWISVRLDLDVPFKEIEYLAEQSYQLICAQLTRKQKIELAALAN